MQGLRGFGQRIVVQRVSAGDKSPGGIVLPNADPGNEAIVIATVESGPPLESRILVNVRSPAIIEVTVDGKKLHSIRLDDVLAVLEGSTLQ